MSGQKAILSYKTQALLPENPAKGCVAVLSNAHRALSHIVLYGRVSCQEWIHKAQGAEYPVVVMPIMMTHFSMLQRNLLYTGVTRAKTGLILVGQKKAVGYCVRNVTVDKRNTLLAERLSGKI